MNRSYEPRTLTEDVLARAAEDWLSVAEVIGLIRGITDPVTRRDLAIGVISRLMVEELIVVGDITEGTHVPWASSIGESIVRIISEWVAREDPLVMPGELAWLDTTERGQQLGERVWRRDESPSRNHSAGKSATSAGKSTTSAGKSGGGG